MSNSRPHVDPFDVFERLTSGVLAMGDELDAPLVEMVRQAHALPEPLQSHAVIMIAPHLIDLRDAIQRVADQLDRALADLPDLPEAS